MRFNKKNIDNKHNPLVPSKEMLCLFCGYSAQTIFVHGHEQCVVCKTNVVPCCQGDVFKSSYSL